MHFLDASNLVNVSSFNILTLGAAYLGTFVTVYVYHRNSKKNMAKENEDKWKGKADKDYVDQQDRGLHKRVNELRDNHGKLDEKIKIMSENVAWIRGFLDPSKK